MFKRNLFKRFLPIALSVAMTVQSLPVTSYAAEGTTEPETAIEQTTDEVVDDDAGDKETGGSEAVDGQNEGENEESKPTETQATVEETKPAETQQTEETKAAEETKTAEENKEAEEAQTETEEALEEAADNAEAALKAEITTNLNWLQDCITDYYNSLSYDSTAEKVVTTFNDEEDNPFGDLLDNYIKKTTSSYDIVSVTAEDSTTASSLRNNLIYTWQVKGEDGKYSDMAATVPANAGEYKLVISLDPSLATAEAASIDFEIKKVELEVRIDEAVKTQKSGVTVKEIKDAINEAVTIFPNTDKNKNAVKPLTITVRESIKTEALADDVILKKGNDYSVDVVAELTDECKANYEIKQLDVIDLNIADLQKTALTITNNLVAEEKEITRTFNGEEVAAPTVTGDKPEIGVEVTVVGKKDEATGKDKVLLTSTKAEDYDKLTKTWLDADGYELEGAPVDAGVYFYEIKYTDAEGIYEEASAKVKVVVEAAKVVLKPELSVAEYLTGAMASEVTKNATYKLAAADGTTKFDFDPETFWGVSYNNPSKPQSYAPVFKLQKGETKTVDGKATTTWTDVPETKTISDPSGAKKVGDQEVTISYRLVPKGTKALFVNGQPNEEIDIHTTDVNTAEKNYEVDLSAAVVDTNAVAVTVKSSANATIDVSAMIPEGMGSEDINKDDKLYTKIYDGVQLYADRAAYKKAVVKDADGKEIAKDTDDTLSYTWYMIKLVDDTDDNGNKVKKPVLNGTYTSKYAKNPSNAGYYALQISYYDAEHKYTAKPAYIYFQIKEQLIKVVPVGVPDAYAGVYVYDYIAENEDSFNYTIKKIPGNDLSLADDKLEEIADLSKENNKDESIYSLYWYVLEGDNTDKNVAKFSTYWSNFKLGVPYKLVADLDFVYNPYDEKFEDLDYKYNYSDNYKVVVDGVEQTECTSAQVDINVKPMGSTEIDITVDSSKLTTDTKVYDGKPIDLSADIANGLIKVTNKVTGEVIPVTGENAIGLTYVWKYYDDDGGYWYETENITDAYQYQLSVKFNGDDTYKAYNGSVNVGNFTIEPRELTITPVLRETITAGLDMRRLDHIAQVFDESKTEIKGYIEEDAEAFAYTETIADAKAFTDENENYKPIIYVNEFYLRTGKKYEAKYSKGYISNDTYAGAFEILNEDALKDKRAENYKLVVTPVEFQTNKRGNSTVDSTDYYNYDGVHVEYIDETRLKATYNDLAATIVPVEGIPYSYEVVKDEEGNWISGNFFVFKITKPAEFNSDSSYILKTKALYENSIKKAGGYVLSVDSSNIIVAFNAEKPASGDNIRTFDIRWEDGYVENFTVDFKNAELEDDLTAAVAPKSLAFNGVDGKMIAGEHQQLDVKITKNQIDDIVCLYYEVTDGKDFVSVTDKGYVTALKKGTATISVYPVRYDMKGNMEKLNFKAVTTKITVSDVSAPKLSKPYAYDTVVKVNYTKPKDGYRREIYVLPGKLKVDDFEAKIAAMNQGQFDGVMIIGTHESGYDGCGYLHYYNSSNGTVTYYVNGLDIETEYTVYVRNVSGIRTIEDGSFVALSHNGSVQTFKTTKVQLDALNLYFDDKQKVTYDEESGETIVNLSEKSVKITAEGKFAYKPENAAADWSDDVWYDLPLTSQQKNIFVDPKLTFYATASTNSETTKKDGYTLQIGGRYYAPSQIAKVDKKGDIKLSGIGYTWICVYDSISGQSDWYKLHITSDITKITAKPVTLKVGQYYGLMNSLTFYNGNAKLKGHIDQDVVAEIVSGEGIGLDGTVIYCKAPNKTAQVKVSLADKPEVSTTVTIKTKALDPVKSLKATNIMDNECTITFTHSVEYGQYRIEVRNGRNALVRSELVKLYSDWSKSNYTKDIYAYEYTVSGLVRKSDYKISVTPVCEAETAKAATVKVKTTDIPAYRGTLLDKDDLDTGMSIIMVADWRDINNGYFTSGMSYTLRARANAPADGRTTDTLTWKSSNTKVATVKAVPNTYTATFTALKSGYTDIEVSSKLRKGVIARYRVRVKAVGAAGDSELGDFEEVNFDPYYEGTIEVLTENNPVRVVADNGGYDYTWVKFQAPAYGYYTFTCNGRVSNQAYYEEPYNDAPKKITYNNPLLLKEGDTVYLKVYGSFTMTVSGEKYQKLTTTTSVNASKSKYVIFTAPEDNYYTFEATKSGKVANYQKNGGTSSSYTFKNGSSGDEGLALKKGDVVTFTLNYTDNYDISVKCRKNTAFSETAVSTGELKKGDEIWYTYTAPVTGSYTFKSTEATGVVKADQYDSITSTSNRGTIAPTGDNKDFELTLNLKKGDTIALRVYTESATAVTAKVSVTRPAVDTVVAGTAKGVTVAKNGETWVSFEVDEADTMYNFKITGDKTKGTKVTAVFYKDGVADTNKLTTISDLNVIDYSNNSLDKKKVVYIKLTTDNTTDDNATVNVLVTKRTASAIEAGKSQELTVANDGLYFYEFTAPSYGVYVFESKVTANKDGKGTHKLVADQYAAVKNTNPSVSVWASAYAYSENDFYKEVKLSAGEKKIFAVKPTNTVPDVDNNAVTTKANISVTKVVAETLPSEEIVIPKDSKGTVKWYKFTATADDTYTIKTDVTSGTPSVTNGASLDADINSTATSQNLTKGQTLFFKVVATTNDETKLKITLTGKKSSIQEIPAGAFEIKGGDTVTYKYTVKKAGRYKVDFKSNTEGVTASVERGNDSLLRTAGTPVTTGEEILFTTVGETLYFNVTTSNADATKTASVELHVTEIQPAALDANGVKVGAGESKWVTYTVPAAGRYTFEATYGDPKADASVFVKNYDGLAFETYYSYDRYNEAWLKVGKVLYFNVTNTTAAEITVKLEIKAIDGEAVTAGTAKTVALTKAGETKTKWFKFTADADMYYSFDVENATGMNTSWYYYVPNSDKTYSGDKELKAGETVLIKMTRTDSAEAESLDATLTITKRTYTTLKEKENLTITVKNGDSQYIEFTPSKTGYYEFYVKDVPTGVTVTGSSNYDVRHCTIAQKVHFQIGANFTPANADETKSFTLYAKEVTPAELTSEAEVSVAKNHKAWFTFTAPDDGIYKFSDDSTVADVMYEYCDENAYTNTYPMDKEYAMRKGDKLTFAVSYSNIKASSTATEIPANTTFKLSVTKVEPIVLALDTELEVGFTAEEITAGTTTKYIAFKAPKTGAYKFTKTAVSGSLTAQYTSTEEEISSSIENCLIKEGTTEFIKITATSPATAKILVEDKLETIAVNQEKLVELTAGEKRYFKFTAPSTGTYKFFSTNAENPSDYHDSYGYLYNDMLKELTYDDDSGEGNNFKIDYELEKGQTVYLMVMAFSENRQISFNVLVEAE